MELLGAFRVGLGVVVVEGGGEGCGVLGFLPEECELVLTSTPLGLSMGC